MIHHPVHNIRPKQRGDTIPAVEFNRIVSAVQSALRTRTPHGYVSNDFALLRHQPRGVPPFAVFAGQVYAAMNYAPNRWIYALREMEWDQPDGDWDIKSGGRTTKVDDNDFAKPAVNGCEAGNDGVGIETVGVDFSEEPLASSSFAVIEIKNLPVVPVFAMPLGTTNASTTIAGPGFPDPLPNLPAYWFSVPNVIDGGCAPGVAAVGAGSASCSCASCCLSASAAGPGIDILDNGTIIVRTGAGLGYVGKDLFVRTGGMLYATEAGGVQLHPPRLDVYDATGGQAITTAATVTLDTVRIQDVDTKDLRGRALDWTKLDEIEVKVRGRLIVVYRLSLLMSAFGKNEGKCYIELEHGSGYAVVPGTDAWLGGRQTGSFQRTASGHVVLDVAAGDLVRFRAERTAGTAALTTVAGASAMSALLERS